MAWLIDLFIVWLITGVAQMGNIPIVLKVLVCVLLVCIGVVVGIIGMIPVSYTHLTLPTN